MNVRFLPLAVLVLAVSTAPVRAWDPYGHMMVSHVAVQRLAPDARAEVERLVRDIRFPGTAYTPVTVGCWMDDIRQKSPDIPFSGKFKPWHYINWGLEPGDTGQPLQPGDDDDTRSGNVIQGLVRCTAVLGGGTDPYITDKATALAMLFHLVADVHQPLHCGSQQYTLASGKPASDSGGNRVLIENAPGVVLPGNNRQKANLHAFWDAAYRAKFNAQTGQLDMDPAYDDYTKHDLELLKPLLASIEGRVPDASMPLDSSYESWGRESNALARDVAYGRLPSLEDHTRATVDEAYVKAAGEIGRQRIVLAGWRLAACLNRIYATAPVPSAGPVK